MGYTRFSDNDRTNIASWVSDKGISMKCQACTIGEYALREGIVTPQYMDFEESTLSDDGLPLIAFQCGNCAHLLLFALYKILPYYVD